MTDEFLDAYASAIQTDAKKVADRAAELSKLREAMSKITVLAHHGMAGGNHAQALMWIKKACHDEGYSVTAVNGKPT